MRISDLHEVQENHKPIGLESLLDDTPAAYALLLPTARQTQISYSNEGIIDFIKNKLADLKQRRAENLAEQSLKDIHSGTGMARHAEKLLAEVDKSKYPFKGEITVSKDTFNCLTKNNNQKEYIAGINSLLDIVNDKNCFSVKVYLLKTRFEKVKNLLEGHMLHPDVDETGMSFKAAYDALMKSRLMDANTIIRECEHKITPSRKVDAQAFLNFKPSHGSNYIAYLSNEVFLGNKRLLTGFHSNEDGLLDGTMTKFVDNAQLPHLVNDNPIKALTAAEIITLLELVIKAGRDVDEFADALSDHGVPDSYPFIFDTFSDQFQELERKNEDDILPQEVYDLDELLWVFEWYKLRDLFNPQCTFSWLLLAVLKAALIYAEKSIANLK